jgi:hypothetical protein
MYLLKGIKESDERLRVTIIYNLDAEENENIDKTDGVEVDSQLEQPAPKRGISYIYYVNPKTKEQWYEEVERPLTQEEMLEEQNEKLDLIMMAQLEQEGIL